ncbi:juvenile hormone esterase-like [Phlebotomus argentipes]|uniref:juvenile hormone esterase-like n=1 Tax=Phlebotomus argentipes TaxID=94469 RepID=UPI002892A24A|nr:juvenile hormone esterase-like [Phlebotomus argentipes]
MYSQNYTVLSLTCTLELDSMDKHRNFCLTFLLVLLIRTQLGHACRTSEFSCRGPNGLCLPLDKYCDGKDDCGDGSDEPKFCTEICTKSGCIRGVFVSETTKSYEAFYGIPYAEPPVGKLRFENPVSHRGWSGFWDASYPREVCIQKNYFLAKEPIVGSEDCLYLNIYRPASDSEKNLPVLVFIHGDGFLAFSSDPGFLGPDYFMANGQVILVTLNYRLGMFGFLCSGDAAVQGNFGFKDQQLALEWITLNIAYFGGDVNAITLAGHGAGAASANLHMLNPKSQELFHQTFLLSGVALASCLLPVDCAQQFRQCAKYSGIKDWNTASIDNLAEQLKKIDDLRLILAADELFVFPGIPITTFRPALEGDWQGAFITEDPRQVWTEGRFPHKPMLFSFTSHEGIAEARFFMNDTVLKAYNRNILTLLPQQLDFDPRYVTDVIDFYLDDKYYVDNSNMARYYDMFSDRLFRYPIFTMIKQYLNYVDVQKNPVYIYEFEFEFLTGEDINLGVSHFDDLMYLFSMPSFFPPFAGDSPESRMSEVLIRTVVNFVANKEIKVWRTFKPCSILTSTPFCERQCFKRYSQLDPNQVVVSVSNKIDVEMVKLWTYIDNMGSNP